VSAQLETGTPGVFAAGDVAEYESVIHGGRRIRVEHWDVAFNQGRTAALNMLGKGTTYDVVPYFFSDLSDWAAIEYLGPAYDWDREVVRGSPDEGAFTVFYLDGGRVAGALSVGRSGDLQPARRWIAEGIDLGDQADRIGDLCTDLEGL
jgi:3-phenylpropionate/trans-cinnamate dioxygenase ferredoxin reductase subunit